jgi:hypothetical protein
MTAQERIIRNALDASKVHGTKFGTGGVAAAKVYTEDPLSPETLLCIIAIMANGLAELEPQS